MTLFSELKRRNVLRMAAFYLAAAWLVMQVAEVLMGLGKLPDVVGLWVLAMLAIGFPIALIVSWFWDITPEGIVRDAELPEAGPTPAISGRRVDFVIIAMLAAAVVLLLVWEPPASGEDAITVLPFESMMGEEEPFPQGVSLELQNLLARLGKFKVKLPPEKDILSRFSDVPTLAREMNVRWVLKGSVRRAEQRVRISAQLIDAQDDAAIVWSDVFDRELSDLFAIQTEIARLIAGELGVVFDEPAERRLAVPPTQNMEAYSAYLLGRQRLTDRKVAELADAVEQFALAIELDPQFAGAYSGLADACFAYQHASGGQSHEHCPSSLAGREQLARKALELDPESGEAWTSLGRVITSQANSAVSSRSRSPDLPKIREQFRQAFAAYERGLELNPTQPQGYQWYGQALINVYAHPDPPSGWIKAWQAGVWQPIFDKGLEVDPLSIWLHYFKAQYPIWTRTKEEAMRHAQRVIEIAPDSPLGYKTVAEHEWFLNGRIDESVRWMTKSIEIDPQNPEYPWYMSGAYAALGDPDMALAYVDLVKALIAPDSRRRQYELLASETMTRLGAGRIDAHQVAELLPPSTEFKDHFSWWLYRLALFADLATGRPADALDRIEAYVPTCLGATEIPKDELICPHELVRVYRELGDHSAAEALSAANVRRAQLWVDGFPHPDWRRQYAEALVTAGRTDEALDVLENLVSSGWRPLLMRFKLYYDVNFDAIRDHPRFQAIVATIEADMAQQLENVRAMQRRGEVPTLEEVQALIAAARDSG